MASESLEYLSKGGILAMTLAKIIIIGILSIAGVVFFLMISLTCIGGGSVSWTWHSEERHYLCQPDPITIVFPGGSLELKEQ